MNVQDLNQLKEAVEQKLGHKILSSFECHLLLEDLLQHTDAKLSFNTLRRFFGLMNAQHQPSSFTLNTLCQYCGFASFSEFKARKRTTSPFSPLTYTSLLDYSVLLFKNINVTSIDDITFIHLVQETINYLELYPDIIDQFQRQIAKTGNGQCFYFEQFVNIDKLNGFYGKGLFYYLTEKKTPQARLFANSLLCFRSWLNMDSKGLETYYQEVRQFNLEPTLPLFVCARYFATQLYFAEVFGWAIEPTVSEAKQFYATLPPSKYITRTFEYILAEALTLIEQYEEALFYIEAIKERINFAPSHLHCQLLESVYLYEAIGLAYLGKLERAKDLFASINPTNFDFLSKQFHSILYLLLKKELQQKERVEKQLRYLVAQTGFTRLELGNVKA